MYLLMMLVSGLVLTDLLIFPIQNPLPLFISGAAEFYSMLKVADGN